MTDKDWTKNNITQNIRTAESKHDWRKQYWCQPGKVSDRRSSGEAIYFYV